MPRNGSGTYSAPVSSFNPATNGTEAAAVDFNGLLTDLSTALTQSLSKDGQTPASSRIPFANGVSALAGTTSSVSYAATGDLNTGIYFPAADKIGLVAGGTEQVRIESALVAPIANNTVDLGSSSNKFKDGYFAGNLDVDGNFTVVDLALTGDLTVGDDATITGDLIANSTTTLKGDVVVNGTSAAAGSISLFEDTDNGTNYVKVISPSTIASNRTQTLQDKDGTIATTTDSIALSQLPAGTFVDGSYAAISTSDSTTTALPMDNTIPQITEGKEALTLSFTPKSATNILIIECGAVLGCSSNAKVGIALFQDATANALSGSGSYINTSAALTTAYITYRMVAGTTSATTFRMRFGGESGNTVYLNAFNGTQLFGGVCNTFLRVTEIKA